MSNSREVPNRIEENDIDEVLARIGLYVDTGVYREPVKRVLKTKTVETEEGEKTVEYVTFEPKRGSFVNVLREQDRVRAEKKTKKRLHKGHDALDFDDLNKLRWLMVGHAIDHERHYPEHRKEERLGIIGLELAEMQVGLSENEEQGSLKHFGIFVLQDYLQKPAHIPTDLVEAFDHLQDFPNKADMLALPATQAFAPKLLEQPLIKPIFQRFSESLRSA